MTGMPKDPPNLSRGSVVALLENVLDRAVRGEIDYVCVVHNVAGTNQIQAKWQGVGTRQVLDACKGLDALRREILEKATRSE